MTPAEHYAAGERLVETAEEAHDAGKWSVAASCARLAAAHAALAAVPEWAITPTPEPAGSTR